MADGGAGLHPAAAYHHFVHALIEVPMRSFFPLVLTGIAVTPAAAQAADMQVTVNIPRLNVAEYHKPYVAIWVEGASLAKPTNLAVWYEVNLKKNEGANWLDRKGTRLNSSH